MPHPHNRRSRQKRSMRQCPQRKASDKDDLPPNPCYHARRHVSAKPTPRPAGLGLRGSLTMLLGRAYVAFYVCVLPPIERKYAVLAMDRWRWALGAGGRTATELGRIHKRRSAPAECGSRVHPAGKAAPESRSSFKTAGAIAAKCAGNSGLHRARLPGDSESRPLRWCLHGCGCRPE